MRLLIKYPTRARSEVFKKTYEIWRSKLSGKHEVEFVISMDVDDRTMNNSAMHNFLDQQKNLSYCYGENHSKIMAINANMDNKNFDVVVLASDDMIPEVDGYDDIILTKMNELYPDTFGALHFNDGRTGTVLCTLCILGKKMYDHFGYLYHPDYVSLFCDQESMDVCMGMGKMTFVDQVIIRHAWVDATGQDPLHKRNEAFYHRDEKTYHARKKRGFPKETINNSASMKKQTNDPRRKYNNSRRRP